MVRLNCESSADIVSRVGAGQLGNSDRKMAFFSPKRPENLRPVFSSPKRPEQILGRFSLLRKVRNKSSAGFLFSETSGTNIRPVSLLRNVRNKSSAGFLFSETSGTNLWPVFSSPKRPEQIFGRFSLLRNVRDKSLAVFSSPKRPEKSLAGFLFSETSGTNLRPIQLSSKYVLGTFTGNQS